MTADPGRPADPGALPYRPQLDGLRALAVMAVVFQHTWAPQSPWGHLGVRLFFVLSGYLITAILLGAGRAGGAHALASFYARRALRLFPAYYAVLAATILLIPAVRASAPWHFAYATNLHIALTDRWDPWQTSHFWSLAVEEQFYLGWAPLVLFAPARAIPWLAGALVAGGPLFRGAVRLVDPTQTDAHVLLPAAFDAFGIGALLAVVAARGLWSRLPPRALVALAIVGLAAFGLTHEASGASVIAFTAAETLALAPLAALVAAGAQGDRGWLGRVLGAPILVQVGRMSYGVYLYHVLVWWGLQQAWPDLGDPGPLPFLAVSACTLVLAAASFRWLERPFTALKARLPYAAPPRKTQPTPQAA